MYAGDHPVIRRIDRHQQLLKAQMDALDELRDAIIEEDDLGLNREAEAAVAEIIAETGGGEDEEAGPSDEDDHEEEEEEPAPKAAPPAAKIEAGRQTTRDLVVAVLKKGPQFPAELQAITGRARSGINAVLADREQFLRLPDGRYAIRA